MRTTPLQFGEPAPWFTARSTTNPDFKFNSVGGRFVVMTFFESAGDESSRRILDELLQHRDRFDDTNFCFFGVSVDPDDERLSRVEGQLPGIHIFWDYDKKVSQQFGAVVPPGDDQIEESYRRFTVVLDHRLRALALLSFDEPETHVPSLMSMLDKLPLRGPTTLASVQAPVLVVPRIFELDLCRMLIEFYEEEGGRESGFMRDVDGQTVQVVDYDHKRRKDREITDEQLRGAAMRRIHDRLLPEIAKAFQFHATRMERHIVSCYESEAGGHFRAHRDNLTKGTAHRRFAVSLHLNTGEYEGGELRFPEFGRQLYRAPVGGAVVFSCSLLHEATPVTRGRRYVYLPFLYDEAAAKIRLANQQFIEKHAAAGKPSPL